jgi:cysteine-rich repeat protein
LAGVAAERIASAVLRFNIDDVLSTLGPGTELSGRAADEVLVHFYDGDGAATLADYRRTDEAPVRVDTGPGAITDATLAQSGALAFDVDVRARLVAALAAGTPFLGILWRTTDSPTGTSLDDGQGGSPSGEPSDTSAGSRMPFLTVTIADPPEPGCGNGLREAGEVCDDGNRLSGDCCDADCAPEPDGSACDDGDGCTRGDTCRAGTCGGALPCGDGVADAACHEECDDGGTAPGDGCSATCRWDSLVGGTGPRECLVTVAFVRPVRDDAGAVGVAQACPDGAACDGDAGAGTCGFDVAVCLAATDARTPACTATGTLVPRRVKPARAGTSTAALGDALARLPAPGCTAPVRIDVPLRKRGKKPGKLKLVVGARSAATGADRDVVVLTCLPAQ